MVPHRPKLRAHIRRSLHHDAFQKRSQLLELAVERVVVPSANVDAVLGLEHEVLLDVIYDYRLLEVSAQLREVLHIDAGAETGVVAVQAVTN